jgi:hypothetical protein
MLKGDFSRPWKCLAGFKFLYITAKGDIQWCAQQRDYRAPLAEATPASLKMNDHHKPCEAGCSLGCVRMVSHTLGEPLKTMGASLSLVFSPAAQKQKGCAAKQPTESAREGTPAGHGG